MRAFIINACLLISGSLAGAGINQGDDIFGTYIKSADYISSPSKGILHSIVSDLPVFESLPFTPEDYEIIGPQLINPEILGPLLIEKKLSIDMYGLSVSPEEAESGILALAEQFKQAVGHRISEAIRYKAKLPSKEEVMRRVHATIDRLSEVEDLENTLLAKAGRALDEHPETVDYIRILVTALPGPFEHDVLGYMREFFKEASSYDSDVADKLRNALVRIQQDYSLLPEDYYQKLALAIAKPAAAESESY